MVLENRPRTTFNSANFEVFWYWINERHRIYLKRKRGDSKPWTEDTVLQNWKFCNPFRKNDAQSQLLTKNVLLPHWNDDPGLILFNIYAFRAFNLWLTYRNLVRDFGKNKWLENYSIVMAEDSLQDTIMTFGQLTSGAYMIRGRDGVPKYKSIAQTLDHVWRRCKPVAHIISNSNSMKFAFDTLKAEGFWGWGDFTTYQIVLDLIETRLLENPSDLNTWCEFGPGATRGLRCIWPRIKNQQRLKGALELYKNQAKYLEPHVPPMTLQDIEFSLCELSKYIRIANGGKGKEGYDGGS